MSETTQSAVIEAPADPENPHGGRVDGSTAEDAVLLERDLGYLMEFLDKLWEQDVMDDVRAALDDRETPALSMVTECVMWRVRQRLRDGFWDCDAYERFLQGEGA